MTEIGLDDPWTDIPGPRPEAEAGAGVSGLKIEVIESIEPLDIQAGAFPKKTVPDALFDALFGQPEPTPAEIKAAGGDPATVPSMRTYAILDAAKVVNLPELLERSGLDHRCMFRGRAYDDLMNVAPWIVGLEEGSSFTRNLFTRSDAAWHLWDTEPGIYIRSRGGLEEMWRHFRKFTRVQDEKGKWFYFRFWETHWAARVIRDIGQVEADRFLSGILRLIAVRANGRVDVISRSSI